MTVPRLGRFSLRAIDLASGVALSNPARAFSLCLKKKFDYSYTTIKQISF